MKEQEEKTKKELLEDLTSVYEEMVFLAQIQILETTE